jgi:thiamine pyrophosphate-dependent acetolactate synthase large subunit-like protein
MSGARLEGAGILCTTLEQLGVRHVFGMPGTQNVALFESLRKSRLRTIVPTHELAASFMAGAYYRVSGRPGVLVTIPGPGFTYALTGLAEARLDSAAVVHIAGAPAEGPGRQFNLQALDQAAIAAPLVKRVIEAPAAGDVRDAVVEAHRVALAGEPGPVLLQIAHDALVDHAPFDVGALATPPPPPEPRPGELDAAVRLLRDARRVVVFAGQGTLRAPDAVRRLVERLSAPVLTTPSARGVVPEDHPLSLGFDAPRGAIARVNDLMAQADVVLVLGCKLGHNGTAGFQLRLPPGRTIQVDTSRDVLGAAYDVALAIEADAGPFLDRLHAALDATALRSGWAPEEVATWRQEIRAAAPPQPEPRFSQEAATTAEAFFARLRGALPREAILVTDSGQHQVMARRHYQVLAPVGLLFPSDLQSMGFGIPAAIAAKLAAPERPVVAIVGDGGLAMTGLELATAVRERTPITVLVFQDGRLGQIWSQQVADFGRTHGTQALPLDVEALAAATGAEYTPAAWTDRGTLPLDQRAVRLAVVGLDGVTGERTLRRERLVKEGIRRMLGAETVEWLRRRLGR